MKASPVCKFWLTILSFSLLSFSVAQRGNILVKADSTSPILTKEANPRLKAPITLRAQDANLSEVLKILAERSGMNFVTGKGVHREKITILLNKTPLDEAINLLVRAAGLSYEIIGNSVLIAEPGKLKDEVGQASYVVELKYATAPEVADMLSDLTKNIKIDAAGNRLVCYTSPRVINEIEKIVKSIDHPHILVVLETRLIEVSLTKDNKYGVDWGKLGQVKSLVNYGGADASTFDKIVNTYKVDNWFQLPLNFDVTLDMMLANGDARMLMDSKLTTTNNRQAALHIGEIIPYTIQSYNIGGQGGANQQIMKEEVGVKVAMVPHVNENNQITLTIKPEVSNIIDFIGTNKDLPWIKTRKAHTTVRVENGQTVFIAGLLSEQESQDISKLPVLGHIPILGMLFQHRTTKTKKSNLIIEITPKIIISSDSLSNIEHIKPFDSNRLHELESQVRTKRKWKKSKNKTPNK